MTDSDLNALTRLIDELNESTVDLAASSAEQTKVQSELRTEVVALKEKLPTFVPKRRFRWVIAAVVLAIIGAIALVLVFRVFDKMAYGLVMSASRPVHVLDTVRNP